MKITVGLVVLDRLVKMPGPKSSADNQTNEHRPTTPSPIPSIDSTSSLAQSPAKPTPADGKIAPERVGGMLHVISPDRQSGQRQKRPRRSQAGRNQPKPNESPRREIVAMSRALGGAAKRVGRYGRREHAGDSGQQNGDDHDPHAAAGFFRRWRGQAVLLGRGRAPQAEPRGR